MKHRHAGVHSFRGSVYKNGDDVILAIAIRVSLYDRSWNGIRQESDANSDVVGVKKPGQGMIA
jgi:hypothetical protein